jgi:tetratricopeptide (TPR) repeat protein
MNAEAHRSPAFDVFLSYNSTDKPNVRALAELLRGRCIKVWLDEDEIAPGRPWQKALEDGINTSRTGAVLVGKDGLGPWENEEMRSLLSQAVGQGRPVIPVLLPGAPEVPSLPAFLAQRKWVDLRAGLSEKSVDDLVWGITGQKPTNSEILPSQVSAATAPPSGGCIFRHAPEKLVGREKELATLDNVWNHRSTHIITIVAWGGVGKTSLVAHWMISRDVWKRPDFERVFDWSFYSQGTREQGAVSADTFIAEVLKQFGDEPMARSGASPWDKGARLAKLVGDKRSLLVLDGLEPLQYAPGPGMGGKLKDPALEALLKGLAQRNTGLCIVTTREPVGDLKPFNDTTVQEWHLEHLSDEAGAELLFRAGVRRAGRTEIEADDQELKDTVREVRGHALTLNLLGCYLARAYGGDIRRRDQVKFSKADVRIQGGHAFRVMAAYEKLLAQAGEDGTRQLAVMRMLGLFDRPAGAGCLAALRSDPPIAGLTEPLVDLPEEDWNLAVSALADYALVSVQPDQCATQNPQSAIDCHPLIREYFAARLKEHSLTAWRGGHQKLFSYLRAHSDRRPRQLAEMMASFQAVMHGCYAGQYERALGLFRQRIRQKDKNVSVWNLGAFVADFATLRCFFADDGKPSARLCASARAYVFNEVGADLRALGRFEEAHTMIEAAVAIQEEVASRSTAGNRCRAHARLANYWGNKASLHSAIGTVAEAKEAAECGLGAADISEDALRRITTRAALGHALHKMKRFAEAQQFFDEASKINRNWSPRLHGLHGARYCTLLLDLGNYSEVRDYVNDTLPWVERNRFQREIALDHLNRGWALSHIEGPYCPQAEQDLDDAVDILRQTGYQQYVPQALIIRSLFYWRRGLTGDRASVRAAWDDLNEAYGIVHRTGNLIAECDALCVEGRLWLDAHNVDQGVRCAKRLEELIVRTGYELRTFDHGLLQAWIAILRCRPDDGRKILRELRKETVEVGYRARDEDIDLIWRLLEEGDS